MYASGTFISPELWYTVCAQNHQSTKPDDESCMFELAWLYNNHDACMLAVYPALQDSDDEDVQPPAKKRNPKFMKDEAWHPKTKTVKHSQPIREKRPSREHAIKPSVKAELEMAKEYLKDKNVSTVLKM